MRGVLVGQVVRVDHLGVRRAQQGDQIVHRIAVGPILDGAAGVVQEHVRGVLADEGGLLLLADAHQAHLLVGVVGVQARARRASPVGDGDAGQPAVVALVALQDAIHGHDLDVVLVGGDGQVRGAGQCLLGGQPVGDEDLCACKLELHVTLSLESSYQ